ncbi:MAG: FIST C-terminal domain-containing protein [Clostridiales bacterium]|jgi:hypothetical protein|nr:FIST C-terminal domain-containing protein [Clostridiales bacterium]
MKSAVAISYELDDMGDAAAELAATIKENLQFLKNSVGIFFCDADTDGAELTAALKAELGIEIAGMTTLAALDSNGRHEAAIVLNVMTADDCEFSAVVSETLAEGDCSAKITEAYQRASVCHPEETPTMAFAFCPYGMPFSGDQYPNVLSAAAGNAPIIGGIASDDYEYDRARVFLSGREYNDAMVLVCVWGNAKPAFSIRHVTSRFAERIRRVVSAENNIVYKVGDETFIKYLQSFGLKTDVDDPLLAFNSYPMMLTREGGDETPLMRHISGLNQEDGSGAFFGDVPTGTLANICLVNKDDITAACRESMAALINQREGTSYEYSTVFCITCCGRAMILGYDADAEGDILAQMLPKGMTLAGAYCLGEICPALYKDGKASNRFHNCSITMCMI